METILEYIKQRYAPLSIIVYGSYADGTNRSGSDFDALVISARGEQLHDTSFVDGIQLDVFVYPAAYFEKSFDCEDFVQIFDGRILLDHKGLGKALQEKIVAYLQNRPRKTSTALRSDLDWCEKMLTRAKRADAEGWFRWHWVLIDSLEIFCDLLHHPYLGSRRSLAWMKLHEPAAFACYERALRDFTPEALECWVSFLRTLGSTL